MLDEPPAPCRRVDTLIIVVDCFGSFWYALLKRCIPRNYDYNAAQNILREALRLIGLIDQVVSGIGSDEDGNLPVDAT